MQWTDRIRRIKIGLLAVAVVIAAGSLVVSHYLIRDMEREERSKMEVWAEAMNALNKADETTDLSLVLKVLNSNHTIPVIVLDNHGSVLTYRNIEADGNNRRTKNSMLSVADGCATKGDTYACTSTAQTMRSSTCVMTIRSCSAA